MDNILIRKFKKDDGKALNEILSSIEQNPTHIDYQKIAEEEYAKSDAASLVAEVNGKVVGFMVSYILSGVFGIEKSAWIAILGVHSKYMDQGIGKRMAEEIFKIYLERGIQNIFTSVRWDSTDLLSYFKTLGFDRSSFINLSKELK